MASSLEDLLNCDVCLDTYSEPKLLPACAHVFCEKCLWPLLLKKNNVVTCPKCRVENPVPNGNVTLLNTDRGRKEMIAKFLCSDCASVDSAVKLCDQCYVSACPSCLVSHQSIEKCELMSEIRKAAKKLPTSEEWQSLEELQTSWQTFREKNQTQRNEVNESMIELIQSLQERKAVLLNKFDEYDQMAEERLKWLEDMKDTAKVLKKMRKTVAEMKSGVAAQSRATMFKHNRTISNKEPLLTGKVPHGLGTIYGMGGFRTWIGCLGNQIIRRKAGKDPDWDVVWSADQGTLREVSGKDPWSSKHLATGKMELLRHRSGRYEFKVLAAEDDKKMLKTIGWYDGQAGPTTTMGANCSEICVAWTVRSNDKTAKYLTSVLHGGSMCDFYTAMEHAAQSGSDEVD